jgi:hypothetical protein
VENLVSSPEAEDDASDVTVSWTWEGFTFRRRPARVQDEVCLEIRGTPNLPNSGSCDFRGEPIECLRLLAWITAAFHERDRRELHSRS